MSARPGQLRVASARNVPIGSIFPVRAINAAWVRNGLAALQFTIPRLSRRWSTAYVREGNRIEYHHPALPVAWVGVIQEFDESNPDEVTITCTSAEWYYGARYTDLWFVIDDATPAETVQILHQQATARAGLDIELGPVEHTGVRYFSEYELKNILEALTDLATMTGGDFWVEKRGTRHADPWRLQWATQRGSDRRSAVYVSGEVVDRPQWKRSGGKIATALHVIGGGDGGSIIGVNRLYLYLPSRSAIAVYGLVEGKYELSDVADPILLREAGERELATRSRAVRTLGVNLDDRFHAWGTFWLGDTIRLALRGVDFAGYDGPVRVNGIQIDEDSGKMGLVVEVVDG